MCCDILVQQSLQLVAAVSEVVSVGTLVPDNFSSILPFVLLLNHTMVRWRRT